MYWCAVCHACVSLKGSRHRAKCKGEQSSGKDKRLFVPQELDRSKLQWWKVMGRLNGLEYMIRSTQVSDAYLKELLQRLPNKFIRRYGPELLGYVQEE